MLTRCLRLTLLALLLWLTLGEAAWSASPPPVFELGAEPRYDLTSHLEILASPPEGLSLEQVRAEPWRGRFRPVTSPTLDLPSDDLREYWLRFTLAAPPDGPAAHGAWLLATDYVFLGKIDFHRPGAQGWETIRAGLYLPFVQRELTNRGFVFQLPRLDQGPATCYLRLETRGLNPIRFQVWSLPAFIAHAAKEDYLYGICFGVLSSMILFNLFIAASLRDRVYFDYVGYMFFALLSLVMLHGQIAAILDLGDQGFTRLFWTSMGLFTTFAYRFMRGVLNTHRLAPLVDRLLRFGSYYGLLILAAGLFDQAWIGRWLTVASGIFSPWLALGAGIASYRRGFAAARYFLVAWGTLAAATTIFALQEVGPLRGRYWAHNALIIGTALESILLSLALAARIRALQQERDVLSQSERRFKELSYTDALTGLYNKRYFSLHLEGILADWAPPDPPSCLLFIDIDDFKRFNDSHGHDQGDLVLRGLARVMTESVRDNDLPCRWGGEEFAVILPGVDLEQAQVIAERIRQRFGQIAFAPADRPEQKTISLGLAQFQPGERPEDLIRRADQVLYQAKRSGKNRLVVAA